MSANVNYSDILATTIESRSRKLADNVTDNNALLKKLSLKGKIKPFSGGTKILQELTYTENANGGWYSGYDILPVGVAEVISAAEFDIKQAAVPVVISGLEMLQNAGRERMIDLMGGRMEVAEATLSNIISGGLYSDGTAAGGKQIDGLDAAVSETPGTGAYGGIDPANFAFWENYYDATAVTAATIGGAMNTAWAALVRGADRPDLIMADNVAWSSYMASLQAQQRFTSPDTGNLGFPSVKFMDADVVLDGGIQDGSGTGAPAGTMYFLNCNYVHYRPHSKRNMVSLSPEKRYATNQDAEVQIIGWAGNLTCSGRKFQGRIAGITVA
jgi:hypothetical protein